MVLKKPQFNWCKWLFSIGKLSSTSILSRHLTSVKFVELNSLKKQKTCHLNLVMTMMVLGS
jgi:hypothetical protein